MKQNNKGVILKTVDYWFSPISPFTYFAADRLEQTGVNVNYLPINIGAVFGATGGVPVPQRSPQRQAYRLQELKRLAAKTGLPVNLQPKHFPVDSTLACQWMLVAKDQNADVGAIARALLKAVWAEDKNISDESTLVAMSAELGLPEQWIEQAKSEGDRLTQVTDEAIEAGVFGSPFYRVDDQMFWGQEKIEEVADLAK